MGRVLRSYALEPSRGVVRLLHMSCPSSTIKFRYVPISLLSPFSLNMPQIPVILLQLNDSALSLFIYKYIHFVNLKHFPTVIYASLSLSCDGGLG